MLEQVINLSMLAGATSTVTLVVTRSSLFKSLRSYIRRPMLKELITCPFCFSIWVAAFFTTLMPILTFGTYGLGWLVQWLVTAGLSAPMMNIIFNSIAGLTVHED